MQQGEIDSKKYECIHLIKEEHISIRQAGRLRNIPERRLIRRLKENKFVKDGHGYTNQEEYICGKYLLKTG